MRSDARVPFSVLLGNALVRPSQARKSHSDPFSLTGNSPFFHCTPSQHIRVVPLVTKGKRRRTVKNIAQGKGMGRAQVKGKKTQENGRRRSGRMQRDKARRANRQTDTGQGHTRTRAGSHSHTRSHTHAHTSSDTHT